MLRGDLQPHSLAEIIAYYADGTHDDELHESDLHKEAVEGADSIDANTRFYVMPVPDIGDDDRPDWTTCAPEIAEFASSAQLGFGYLGEYLADTLWLIRDRAPGSTLDRIAEAFSYYLSEDTWPDWLE